jgi:hypothetical protein
MDCRPFPPRQEDEEAAQNSSLMSTHCATSRHRCGSAISDTQEFFNAMPDCPNLSPLLPSFGQARVTCLPCHSAVAECQRDIGTGQWCQWLRHGVRRRPIRASTAVPPRRWRRTTSPTSKKRWQGSRTRAICLMRRAAGRRPIGPPTRASLNHSRRRRLARSPRTRRDRRCQCLSRERASRGDAQWLPVAQNLGGHGLQHRVDIAGIEFLERAMPAMFHCPAL